MKQVGTLALPSKGGHGRRSGDLLVHILNGLSDRPLDVALPEKWIDPSFSLGLQGVADGASLPDGTVAAAA